MLPQSATMRMANESGLRSSIAGSKTCDEDDGGRCRPSAIESAEIGCQRAAYQCGSKKHGGDAGALVVEQKVRQHDEEECEREFEPGRMALAGIEVEKVRGDARHVWMS